MDKINDYLDQAMKMAIEYLPKLALALLLLYFGFKLANRLSSLFARLLERLGMSSSLLTFSRSLANIGLKMLLIFTVAAVAGVDITAFVAVLAAAGFAVGLALQGNLANFASGVLILIFKFYKVGDFIKAQGHAGTVKEIQIFHTVLQLLDNSLVIIPNGQVTSGPIQNFTVEGFRRHDATIGIGYDDDIDKAKAVIEEVLKATPNVELDMGYDIFVKELADSSVNFSVRFMASNDNFWPAYRHFIEQIKKEFDRNDIGIPYPQMDLHLDK